MTPPRKTLDELLAEIVVNQPGSPRLPSVWGDADDWYAVSRGAEGPVAYFVHESDAFLFRLATATAELGDPRNATPA